MFSIKNQDCIQCLKNDFKENSIHCVISDIPYGINYEEWDVIHNNTNSALLRDQDHSTFKSRGKPLNGWSESDRSSNEEYRDWCFKWAEQLFRIMIPGSSCLLICGRRTQHSLCASLEKAGFVIRDVLIWLHPGHTKAQHLSNVIKKRKTIPDNLDLLKNCRLGNLSPDYDPIVWAMKPYRGTIINNILTFGVGGFYTKEDDKVSSNVISHISSKIKKSDKFHPTQKPSELMKFLISTFCASPQFQHQIILDPFCGSGTTCIAALQLGYEAVGIELNQNFYEISLKRCNDFLSSDK